VAVETGYPPTTSESRESRFLKVSLLRVNLFRLFRMEFSKL